MCAAVSHLPHLLSSVYLETFFEHRKDWALLGGKSFRDWTRIAGACPEIWMDIFWTNRKRIVADIGRFQEKLREITSLLEEEDQEAFRVFLMDAFQLKEAVKREVEF
ncbi:MAG: prephenate dehydrogenase/arogenate dehydrogenase family protein [Atribacterota bacterium]|nr:prephenate dehydrogenase/arogenate dehydrogenase family protein [Atribacterota bacterium]